MQLKKYLKTKQQRLFLLLCLTTLLDFTLVGYRIYFLGFDISQLNSFQDIANTRSLTFLFLVWNLFLAWIPYWISMVLKHINSILIAVPILFVWLVFFPNAPYIVTDLLHVGYRPPVPIWYDTLLIFSFAWTGLMLGFLSLWNVQQYLEKMFSKKLVYSLVTMAILLCSFGVYLGRYQRWNTWDILTRPYVLFMDILAVIMHPFTYLGSLGLAVVMAGLMGVGYLTMRTLVSE